MRLTRVHVTPQLALAAGAELELPDTAAEHVARVLRLRPGAPLTLFDGRGGEWDGELVSIERGRVRVRCSTHQSIERESPLALTLLQSLARGEKMDWVIQKATELGVQRIVTVSAARSVVQIDDKRAESRLAHWRAVAVSACEQCGRNRVPEIVAPLPMDTALNEPLPSTRLVLTPAAAVPLRKALRDANSLALLIGPEGGFTPQELTLADNAGFIGVGLGARVLRTETAAIAAIAALQALCGDLGA